MKKNFFALALCLAIGVPALAAHKLEGGVKKNTPVTPVQEQEMTLGIVQRDIKIGSSQSDVAVALGSPNIVTRDSDGKDTWIYDKVSSISTYNSSGFGVGIILAGYAKAKENTQTVKKTLTVVIKFDKNSNVDSFTYHMSKF